MNQALYAHMNNKRKMKKKTKLKKKKIQGQVEQLRLSYKWRCIERKLKFYQRTGCGVNKPGDS
jgi:hypothetical protein